MSDLKQCDQCGKVSGGQWYMFKLEVVECQDPHYPPGIVDLCSESCLTEYVKMFQKCFDNEKEFRRPR